MKTRLTERLGIKLPIIQGGMAHLANAELAAAVSNAGGLGQITAATVGGPDGLREQIRRCRRLTDQPFSINFPLGHKISDELIAVAVAEDVPVISVTGGNPEPVFRQVPDHVAKLTLVAGVRQAVKAEALGATAVVVVGAEGGGHVGRDDITTLILTPRVVDAVSIPVVASGGIADGRGLMAALALGADGIVMGSRFIATQECPAHPAYKQAVIAGNETGTVVIERSLGRPGRALRTEFTDKILAAEAAGATLEELLPLISGPSNRRAAVEGELDKGFVWAGQAIGLIDNIPTVAELFAEMMAQARRVQGRISDMLAV